MKTQSLLAGPLAALLVCFIAGCTTPARNTAHVPDASQPALLVIKGSSRQLTATERAMLTPKLIGLLVDRAIITDEGVLVDDIAQAQRLIRIHVAEDGQVDISVSLIQRNYSYSVANYSPAYFYPLGFFGLHDYGYSPRYQEPYLPANPPHRPPPPNVHPRPKPQPDCPPPTDVAHRRHNPDNPRTHHPDKPRRHDPGQHPRRREGEERRNEPKPQQAESFASNRQPERPSYSPPPVAERVADNRQHDRHAGQDEER